MQEQVKLPRTSALLAQELAELPEEIRGPLIERHVSPEWLRVGFAEAKNIDQLYDEMRQAGLMPDVPLIILTALGTDAFKRAVLVGESDELLREENEGKRRLYTALAGSVPRGENRVIEGAGHASIHWSHPGAVAQSIEDLLGRVGM